jgi:hypothetical protein
MSDSLSRYLLILSVLTVVFVSGCIGDGPQGPTLGNGVSITAFEFDMPSYESEDGVRLSLKVKNLGGVAAEEVLARLSGIDEDEWDISDTDEEIDDLSPPNVEFGTEGEERTVTWELEAPELPPGLSQTYRPAARVYYEYKTEATKPITLVNENEFRRLYQQGQTISSGSTQVSAGPLSVEISGKPVKIRDDPVVPISFKITNSGNGVVASRSGDVEDDYKVRLTIELPSEMSFEDDCSKYRSGDEVFLWRGEDIDVVCDVEISRAPDIAVEKTIRVTLEYEYYVDTSTSITVTGV